MSEKVVYKIRKVGIIIKWADSMIRTYTCVADFNRNSVNFRKA